MGYLNPVDEDEKGDEMHISLKGVIICSILFVLWTTVSLCLVYAGVI